MGKAPTIFTSEEPAEIPARLGPIDCALCGARAYLVRRTPDMQKGGWAELRTYECAKCGNHTVLAADAIPPQKS